MIPTKKQIDKLLLGENGEIISLLYNGLNSKQVAKKLGLCFRTVHNKVRKEGEKIGVDNLTPKCIYKAKLFSLKNEGKTISEIKKIAGYKTFKGLEFLM